MLDKQLFFGFALGVLLCSLVLSPSSPLYPFSSLALHSLEEDIERWSKERKANFPSQDQQKGGEMQMAWQTPILKIKIDDFGVRDVKKINNILTKSIQKAYGVIREKNQDLLFSAPSDFTANQQFYEWQMQNNGFMKMFEKKQDQDHIAHLFSLFQTFCDGYLSLIGVPEEEIRKRSRTTHPWATFHEKGSHHLLHSHPSHSLSGVYYAHVPQGSGSLVFEDPRGPLPPFDNRLSLSPEEGLLVIFPSWLLHQVTPTTATGDDGRISIAFNIEGEWELTTAVTASFPVEM